MPLTAGCVSANRAAARVTLRSSSGASNAFSRLKSSILISIAIVDRSWRAERGSCLDGVAGSSARRANQRRTAMNRHESVCGIAPGADARRIAARAAENDKCAAAKARPDGPRRSFEPRLRIAQMRVAAHARGMGPRGRAGRPPGPRRALRRIIRIGGRFRPRAETLARITCTNVSHLRKRLS